MRPLPLRLALAAALVLGLLIPARAAFAFDDVPTNYWDYTAIKYMATDNLWMQDYGPTVFQPRTNERRKLVVRTLVKIYAPEEPVDPTIHFPDLLDGDPFYPFANVAVKLSWIARYGDGRFGPDDQIMSSTFDRVLVRAMGLWDPIAGLSNIHQEDGTKYSIPEKFAEMQLARWLGLHYNHTDETKDLQKTSYVPRDEIAYSIWKALTLPQWKIDGASIFDDVTLPVVTPVVQAFTQYMINQEGYPYIWAGEWKVKSPPGYCCGYQPQGGMDCSGWVWWTLKRNESNYNAAQFHPSYVGWHVGERVSRDMAAAAATHVSFANLLPGNLMFFASNGGHTAADVDHVGNFLGNGWMSHSTGGGPQLAWVASGWYYDHFVWGRSLKAYTGPERRLPMRGSEQGSGLGGDPAVGP